MRNALAFGFVVAACVSAGAASDWALYRASIAAADGALRLHETSAAVGWLAEAPATHRGWEWRYLTALADQSLKATAAHDGPVTGTAFSQDGRHLATTSSDKTVKVWNVDTGAVVVLAGPTASTWSPAFRPGHQHLAVMGSDGTLRVWDHGTRQPVVSFEKLGNGLGAVAWSPDGSMLAGATWTFERGKGVVGWVHLWNFESRTLLWKAPYGVKPISALMFRPDGSTLAVVAKDGLARIYRASDAALVRELSGHTRWANAVAYAPAGTWVVPGSSDETLRLREATSHRALRFGRTRSLGQQG